MVRDKESFKTYRTLLNAAKMWLSKVDLDFEPQANSLIVFDETDRLILTDTKQLVVLINRCLCMCLTAAYGDGDIKGSQRAAADALKFIRYNYITDPPKFQKIKLNVDEVFVTAEPEEKADCMLQLILNRPIIVFCEMPSLNSWSLAWPLLRAGAVISMSAKTYYKILKRLDQQPFKLFIVTDEFRWEESTSRSLARFKSVKG